MNDDSDAQVTIGINGTLTVARAELEKVIQHMLTANPQPAAPPQGQSLKVP